MEEKTPVAWGEIYKAKIRTYETFTHKLTDLIHNILIDIDVIQIEGRTKSVESLIGKIQREGKNYINPIDEITDLTGIRIICYYLEDVDIIGQRLNKEFNIDWENSVDKSQTLDPDKFGYLSVHYIISLAQNRENLTEWKDFTALKAEIQVRTALQHAWAAIDHKLRYKKAIDIPKELRRKSFRLSALLELADSEFSDLKNLTNQLELIYETNLEKGYLDFEINFTSLEVYLETTNQDIKWAKIAQEIGFKKYMPTDIELLKEKRDKDNLNILLNTLSLANINTIRELDVLLDNKSGGTEILLAFYKAFKDFGPPVSAPIIIIMILIINFKKEILLMKISEDDFKEKGLRGLKELIELFIVD